MVVKVAILATEVVRSLRCLFFPSLDFRCAFVSATAQSHHYISHSVYRLIHTATDHHLTNCLMYLHT